MTIVADPRVRMVQEAMIAAGFDPGKPDGIWGRRTEAAIVAGAEVIAKALRAYGDLAPVAEDPVETSTAWRVNWKVALELAHHEAVIRQAYKDSAGVWTWSVGLTSATGHKVERYIGNPQPMQACMDLYVWALQNYAHQVEDVFAGVPLTLPEYAGAVSFHWNTGAIRRANWVQMFKNGQHAAAEASLKTWNKSGGSVVKGLTSRRAAEADLIWRGVWSQDGRITEYTRLTSRSTPIWASAVRVDVEAEVLAAFGRQVEPVIDALPQPDNVPAAPTLTPA